MRWRVVPMTRGHLEAFFSREDASEGLSGPDVFQRGVPEFLCTSNSWALLGESESVWGLGGILEQWEGRYIGWLFLSPGLREYPLVVVRMVKHFLEPVKGRIEATVREDFEQGHRLMRILGFEVENPPGVLRQFDPDGSNHIAYVKIQ